MKKTCCFSFLLSGPLSGGAFGQAAAPAAATGFGAAAPAFGGGFGAAAAPAATGFGAAAASPFGASTFGAKVL